MSQNGVLERSNCHVIRARLKCTSLPKLYRLMPVQDERNSITTKVALHDNEYMVAFKYNNLNTCSRTLSNSNYYMFSTMTSIIMIM